VSQALGIVGGSGVLKSTLLSSFTTEVQSTLLGDVVLRVGRLPGSDVDIVFCQRHGAVPGKPYSLPHEIPFAAIMAAFVARGVEVIVGFCSVGTLHPERLPPGAVVVPHDYYCPAEIMFALLDTRAHYVPGALGCSMLSVHA
jgi:purine nucleoside phosphorylase